MTCNGILPSLLHVSLIINRMLKSNFIAISFARVGANVSPAVKVWRDFTYQEFSLTVRLFTLCCADLSLAAYITNSVAIRWNSVNAELQLQCDNLASGYETNITASPRIKIIPIILLCHSPCYH